MNPLEQRVDGPENGQSGLNHPVGDALPPVVRASDQFHGATESPRRVKAGPLAALGATAAILATSAVPGFRSASQPFPGGPQAPAPVAARLELRALDSVDGIGPLRLDGVFQEAQLVMAVNPDAASSWTDRDDGSASLVVTLVSAADPDTRLEGRLDFKGRIAARDLDRERAGLFVATLGPDASSQTHRLERVDLITDRSATSYDARATAYPVLSGELVGTGRWSGVTLSIRTVPGSSVRRGPWADTDEVVEDTLFARLLWFSTPTGAAPASMPLGVPDHGYGEIALALVP